MVARARGFTLLETMIALIILAIASVGALAGMIAASDNLRRGQSRQYKTMLVESRAQQLLLLDKTILRNASSIRDALVGPLGAYPTSCTAAPCTPDKVAIGAAPWTLDPTGAFFTVTESGVMTAVAPGTIGNPATCADASIPPATLCREVAFLANLPGNIAPVTGTAYTLWTRVVRKSDPSPPSDPSAYAVVDREVVVQ